MKCVDCKLLRPFSVIVVRRVRNVRIWPLRENFWAGLSLVNILPFNDAALLLPLRCFISQYSWILSSNFHICFISWHFWE